MVEMYAFNMIIAIIVAVLLTISSSQAAYNPMINENLYQGDILGIDPHQDRSVVPLDSQRWPGGVIPYVVSIDAADKISEIRKSIENIEENTCIRFVPRTHEHAYVNIYNGDGCNSFVGMIGKEQKLSLSDGCQKVGVILHELLHAVGLYHEHARSDRDDYLTVHWENIQEKWRYAFRKLKPNQNRILTPFDYDSIMLYGSDSFINKFRVYSITKKDGTPIRDPEYKMSISELDAKRINILYECKQFLK